MIRDEAWLELSEVSALTLEALDIQPQDALHVFLGDGNGNGSGNPLASFVVQAVEAPFGSRDELVSLHPVLFEFLSQSSQLIDTTTTTCTTSTLDQQESNDLATDIRVVSIGPLPMEPLEYLESAGAECPRHSNWTIRRAPVVELEETTSRHQIYVTCIFLDPGVVQYTEKSRPKETNYLFQTALAGRLVKKGCVLLLSTIYGFAVLQVSDSSIMDDDDEPSDDEPNNNTSAYRIPLDTTTWQLHVNLPAATSNEDVTNQNLTTETKWHSTIPGYEFLLEELLEIMSVHGSAAAPSGVLVTGCTGVGKSRLASCLAHHYTLQGDRVYYLSTQDLIFRAVTETNLFQDVILPELRHCSLWILDDLHLLDTTTGDESDESQRDVEYTIVQNSILQAIDLYQDQCRIVGIGQVASQLSHELTKIGRLEKNMHMLPPSQVQRITIWDTLLRMKDDDDDVPIINNATTRQTWSSALASTTAGCVVADLVRVYQNAWTRCWARKRDDQSSAQIQWDDLRDAARACIPSQLAELDVTKPAFFDAGLSWAEIHQRSWKNGSFGGYELVKKHVYRHVVVPWKQFLRRMDGPQDDSEKSSWLDPPAGVLFHGPSGCGKTSAVRCLAASLELPMIQVRAADILDKWLGGSEALLRSLFARARAASPCILFLDEIDSIASNRAEDDTNDFTSRILSTLLNEMDGVSSSIQKSRVLVVACTNRLDALDAALLRPGRLQEHFYLGTPFTEDLVDILKLRLERIPMADDVSLEDIAKSLVERNTTGADVEGLCREVCLMAFRRVDDSDQLVVLQTEFDRVIQGIGSSHNS
jgi:SpoVK/Ycf46/Vps4 family AAA+-type ATPase